MWNNVGMARNQKGLQETLDRIPEIREEFYKNVNVLGSGNDFNKNLEHAMRVADYLDFAPLMAEDALHREESCGGHFREEHQTEDHEAKRDDENFSYVAAWEYKGKNAKHELHKEELTFENVELSTRSYK